MDYLNQLKDILLKIINNNNEENIKIYSNGKLLLVIDSKVINELRKGTSKLNLDTMITDIIRDSRRIHYPVIRSTESSLCTDSVDVRVPDGSWIEHKERVDYLVGQDRSELQKSSINIKDASSLMKGLKLDDELFIDTNEGLVPIDNLSILRDGKVIKSISVSD